MLNTAGSIVKLLFLVILLVVNVIGFSYYFRPVASDNLLRIPHNSKFILTLNLKSVSGKLFQELLFNPESFKDKMISEKEKNLVLDNSAHGIDLFSKIVLFSFPYQNEMYSGLTFSIENRDLYVTRLEKNGYKSKAVDGILIFDGNNNTYFVFEESVVVIFSMLESEPAADMAVKYFCNEHPYPALNNEGDFQFVMTKGLFENSSLARYFKMLPSWADQISISGNFNEHDVALRGKLHFQKRHLYIRSAEIEMPAKSELEDAPLRFSCRGEVFESLIQEFLKSVVDLNSDTTGLMHELLDSQYQGAEFSSNKIILNSDLFSFSDLMNPSMVVKFKLLSSAPPVSFFNETDLTPHLYHAAAGSPAKVHLSVAKTKVDKNQFYFYFNPEKFFKDSRLNILAEAFTGPLLIFDEVFISADNIEKSDIYFSGKVTFKNKNVHSMIQVRELFKQLSAII